MNQSPRKQSGLPGPGSSREEVQQWFAHACATNGESDLRQEIDSFLTGLSEPDRSQIRQELEVQASSYGRSHRSLFSPEAGSDQTADHVQLPDHATLAKGGTAEFLAGKDQAALGSQFALTDTDGTTMDTTPSGPEGSNSRRVASHSIETTYENFPILSQR